MGERRSWSSSRRGLSREDNVFVVMKVEVTQSCRTARDLPVDSQCRTCVCIFVV